LSVLELSFEVARNHERLVGVDVGVGEVDLLRALVVDRDTRDGDVGLAALLDRGHKRVELLIGQKGAG